MSNPWFENRNIDDKFRFRNKNIEAMSTLATGVTFWRHSEKDAGYSS